MLYIIGKFVTQIADAGIHGYKVIFLFVNKSQPLIHARINLSNGFTLFEREHFKNDKSLINEIKDLIEVRYNNTSKLLERELVHNSYIYYVRNPQNELVSFFMTTFEVIDGEVFSYMGLMASHAKYSCMYLVAPMILRYIQNLNKKQQEIKHPIISWATTATISSYKCLTGFCDDYYPRENGSYPSAIRDVAKKIALHFKLNHLDSNPFILKQVAHGTAYSPHEKQRINNIIRHKKFTLFQQLGIVEEQGDRLLLIGLRLSENKYNKWLSKCERSDSDI